MGQFKWWHGALIGLVIGAGTQFYFAALTTNARVGIMFSDNSWKKAKLNAIQRSIEERCK